MFRMKILRSVVLSVLLLSIVGCMGKKSQSSKEVMSLRLGAMSSVDYVPFAIAEHMGINDSLGLDVELIKFFSANDRDAAFRTGSIDGTVIDFTGAALQHAGGVPLALVMKHDGVFELMGKGFDTLEGLKGKRIGISRNTVIEYATDRILTEAGLSESDITKIEINKIPLRMEMLLAGEIDASVFPDPFALISKGKGATALISTKSMGFSVTGTIFTVEAIKTKAEAIRTLLHGYNLAVDYLHSHPRSEWIHVLVEDAGFPREVAEQVILPEYTPARLPDNRDIEATITWLKAKGLVPEDYKGEGLIEPSLLP